jgi:hypothetical protein
MDTIINDLMKIAKPGRILFIRPPFYFCTQSAHIFHTLNSVLYSEGVRVYSSVENLNADKIDEVNVNKYLAIGAVILHYGISTKFLRKYGKITTKVSYFSPKIKGPFLYMNINAPLRKSKRRKMEFEYAKRFGFSSEDLYQELETVIPPTKFEQSHSGNTDIIKTSGKIGKIRQFNHYVAMYNKDNMRRYYIDIREYDYLIPMTIATTVHTDITTFNF